MSQITPEKVKRAIELLKISTSNSPNTDKWMRAENELQNLLISLKQRQPPLRDRVKYFDSGLLKSVCIPIILAEDGKHENETLKVVWSLLSNGMSAGDSDEKDNKFTLARGVELGIIELAVRELKFQPQRCDGVLASDACFCYGTPANYVEFSNRIISSGALQESLQLIRTGGDLENYLTGYQIEIAFNTLVCLSKFNPEAVRDLPQLIDVVKPYLSLLSRADDEVLVMIGFRASSVLIRVYGKEDSSKVMEENPIIFEFYTKFLREVMDAGLANRYLVYGTYWTLSSFTYNLAVISLSDANKRLLVPLVPLGIELMALHHHGDRELLHYGMIFLSQVSFDELCLNALMKHKDWIKTIQNVVLADKLTSRETLSLLQVVVNAVFPQARVTGTTTTTQPTSTTTQPTTTTTRRPSAFKRVASLVLGTNTNNNTATTTTASTNIPPQLQVMISYHQNSTGEHAKTLNTILTKHQIKVWIDINDMKGDIQEAMAKAVEKSDVILVLVSSGYKESANCRLECQYAFKNKKPILFLMCEENYKNPQGWLGLLLGQRMWDGIFTPAMIESKMNEILKRIDDTLKDEGDDMVAATSSTNEIATTTTDVHHPHTMSEIMTNILKEVESLKSKISNLETENLAMKSEISQLQSDVVTLKLQKTGG
jgi:hypothetical protein